jgi:hypothetical protein
LKFGVNNSRERGSIMNARSSTMAVVIVVVASTFSSRAIARDLTFEDRVKAQAAIERVYYSHQLGGTRSFEEAVPRAVVEGKVRRMLELSAAVERAGAPINAASLRAWRSFTPRLATIPC